MKIIGELNKYFEIIGLLYGCSHSDFMRKEMWDKAAAEYGINGDELYKKVSGVHKKYFTVFDKNRSKDKEEDFDFFFSDEEEAFILFIQVICANHPEWFDNGLENVTEESITLAFANSLVTDESTVYSAPPSVSEMVTLLENAAFSSSVCWKLMIILRSPKEKMANLVKIVRSSLTAYEKAVSAVGKPLERLLEEFPKGKYISEPFMKDAVLTPVLVYPAGEFIDTSDSGYSIYIGLYAKDVYKMLEKSKDKQRNLLPALKAMSDSSKFDILLSLKTSPKYNLELAEELNLSAATISHHMSGLLGYQLVSVEKRDGRVYYTLSRDTIRDLIAELQSVFSV